MMIPLVTAILSGFTTIQDGQFRYLRLPLSVPFIFFLLMMTSLIALMVVLLVMNWRRR